MWSKPKPQKKQQQLNLSCFSFTDSDHCLWLQKILIRNKISDFNEFLPPKITTILGWCQLKPICILNIFFRDPNLEAGENDIHSLTRHISIF